MATLSDTLRRGAGRVSDPPFAARLLSDTRWSWLWLVVRIYLGYQWLQSGLGKVTNPAWMDSGVALKGFFERAVAIPDAPARPAVSFDWYRTFLTSMLDGGHYVWFAKLVVVGELLIGVALILGAFVGIAAFFGAFMNWNFMMAGTASTNPVLFVVAILLILAWKTAGWWGLDRIILPLVGAPWSPGVLFERKRGNREPEPTTH